MRLLCLDGEAYAEVLPDADGGVTLRGVRVVPRPGHRFAGLSIERSGRRYLEGA